MKIGIAGIRGIPANFGGSETAVEEIGRRLVEYGHDVTVYCRRHSSTTNDKVYKGMRRVVLPSVNTLNLDMPSHTFLSVFHMALSGHYDVIHFHGVGNSLFFPLLRLFTRVPVMVVVDGPDWQRPKWGWAARRALRTSFPMVVKYANTIISDNRPVQRLFKNDYGRDTDYVVYGADDSPVQECGELQRHGLKPGGYFLQVAALVPDKGVHLTVKAYEQLDTDVPLVIVGDTLYAHEYKAELMATKDKRIHFLGYIYGEPCRELVKNAFAYVHPLLVDGTSPALLQAMALGQGIISTDLPETVDVVRDVAFTFKSGDITDLRDKMRSALDHPEQVRRYGELALQRIRQRYNWDIVARQYEALSYRMLGQPYDEAILADDGRG